MNEELLRQVSALLQTSLEWFVPTVNESRRETRSHRKRAGDGVKSAPPFVQVVTDAVIKALREELSITDLDRTTFEGGRTIKGKRAAIGTRITLKRRKQG